EERSVVVAAGEDQRVRRELPEDEIVVEEAWVRQRADLVQVGAAAVESRHEVERRKERPEQRRGVAVVDPPHGSGAPLIVDGAPPRLKRGELGQRLVRLSLAFVVEARAGVD